MLRRLMYSPRVFLALFSLFLLLLAPRNNKFTTDAAAPATEAKHGLTGSYYTMIGEWHSDTPPNPAADSTLRFMQAWWDPNDFQLPKTFAEPVATRVDAQVAFGKGKGFVPQNGKPFVWWPTGYELPAGWPSSHVPPWENLGAVIWRGYIHFPKAGTYYLSTVSREASAVYLNNARVALNCNYGGILVSDAFSYAKEDVEDFVQNIGFGREDVAFKARPTETYVVPVPIDAPRDLPIEIRYNAWFRYVGLDLFWVTPGSPRDASGKPIAQIVPSDALYAEAPGPVEKPAVRSANSRISAEFFYFPVQSTDQAVPLTIRLADKDGNPVAGKRVHVSSTVSGGFADTIIQADKPTDENGITTAKIRGGEGYKVTHDSAIFATDVTDLVDAAQVAHVAFQDVFNSFFLFPEHTFSGQYDGGKIFSVDPLPLRVGRPTKIEVPLINRGKFATELTADAKRQPVVAPLAHAVLG